MVNNKGVARKNVFFFPGVTPMTKMRPAGESGSSLTLSYWEMKQFEPVDLQPGGEISPSLRLDGLSPETNDLTHEAPSADEAVGKGNTLPIHYPLTSTALREALDDAKSDPNEIVRRLHVNWGHASAQQLKRTMAAADDKAGGLIPLVDEVVKKCEVCRAFDAAPAIPVASTSQVSSFNETVQVDL